MAGAVHVGVVAFVGLVLDVGDGDGDAASPLFGGVLERALCEELDRVRGRCVWEPERGFEPLTYRLQVGCATIAPPGPGGPLVESGHATAHLLRASCRSVPHRRGRESRSMGSAME